MIYMERIDVRTEEGVAILSRHPILNSDYIILHRWVTTSHVRTATPVVS